MDNISDYVEGLVLVLGDSKKSI